MSAIKITQVELSTIFKIPDLCGRLEGGTNKNQTGAVILSLWKALVHQVRTRTYILKQRSQLKVMSIPHLALCL